MPLTVYCTQAEMERFFSTSGVRAFSDHEDEGEIDPDVVNDCIEQAAEEINAFALHRYSETALAGSTLIKRWCIVLACYFLCQRRGNPDPGSLQSEFERIMARLEQIPSGVFKLPSVPFRADFRPSFSNLEVQRFRRFEKVRVIEQSGDQVPTQLPRRTTQEYPYA
jgi:phage gp36-like protein